MNKDKKSFKMSDKFEEKILLFIIIQKDYVENYECGIVIKSKSVIHMKVLEKDGDGIRNRYEYIVESENRE